MSTAQQLTLRCKVSIIGESTVGKTSLVQVFTSNKFPKSYNLTLGGEFSVKSVQIPDSETVVELYLHDISGNPLYSGMVGEIFEGTSFYFVVYDISRSDGLVGAKKWLQRARELCGARRLNGCLVGNKVDLYVDDHERAKGAQLAKEFGLEFFLVSAARGVDGAVDAPFNFAAHHFFKSYHAKLDNWKHSP